MSFGTWIAIIIVFFVVFIVSDWLCDKLFKLIKKLIAKRREKKLVKGVMPQGTGKTITVSQRMEDFGFVRVDDSNVLPAEELFKKG